MAPRKFTPIGLLLIGALLLTFGSRGVRAQEEHTKIPLPSYHYGAKIPVILFE